MRVLFVTHDYLPRHPSGTEIHTAELSRRLRELGVETELFTTEKDVSRRDMSLARREWDGMAVHELVNNLFYEGFDATWDDPRPVEAFRRVLDQVRPDLVHVMHLLYLSAGCVEEVARRGLPCVYTLHDFWLTCPRFGQLVHADGSICHTVDFARCGTCLARLKYAQTPLERRVARLLAGVRSVSGLDLSGPARRLAAWASRAGREPGERGSTAVAPPAPDAARAAEARALEAAARRRDGALRERLVPRVDRFLAPSRFLLERFRAWGIPEAKLEHAPYGLELAPFEGFTRRPSPDGRLRVAFLGTLVPHKGPHLVLDAWERLPEALRARATLTLHGPKHHVPEYVAELERRAAALGVALPGGLARGSVPDAFRSIDLLVFPSTWYENQPLTLLEARATATPVLASDLGGTRELVDEGRTGWRFPAGDAGALARRLAEVLEDPGRLAALDFTGAAPLSMEEAAGRMLARYRELGAGA